MPVDWVSLSVRRLVCSLALHSNHTAESHGYLLTHARDV